MCRFRSRLASLLGCCMAIQIRPSGMLAHSALQPPFCQHPHPPVAPLTPPLPLSPRRASSVESARSTRHATMRNTRRPGGAGSTCRTSCSTLRRWCGGGRRTGSGALAAAAAAACVHRQMQLYRNGPVQRRCCAIPSGNADRRADGRTGESPVPRPAPPAATRDRNRPYLYLMMMPHH